MKALSAGDKAPSFTGIDQDGNRIKLSDFKGRKLALYFYPADLTPTCTVQACNLRDNFEALTKEEITVIGVSPDDEKKHRKFINKHGLPFPLVADTDQGIAKKYGVWGLKQFMGRHYIGLHRTTFLIDEKGRIADVIVKPKSKDHAAEILERWKGEGVKAASKKKMAGPKPKDGK